MLEVDGGRSISDSSRSDYDPQAVAYAGYAIGRYFVYHLEGFTEYPNFSINTIEKCIVSLSVCPSSSGWKVSRFLNLSINKAGKDQKIEKGTRFSVDFTITPMPASLAMPAGIFIDSYVAADSKNKV